MALKEDSHLGRNQVEELHGGLGAPAPRAYNRPPPTPTPS